MFHKYSWISFQNNKYLGAQQKESARGAVCGQPGIGEEKERGGIFICIQNIFSKIYLPFTKFEFKTR